MSRGGRIKLRQKPGSGLTYSHSFTGKVLFISVFSFSVFRNYLELNPTYRNIVTSFGLLMVV